jgi:hypothetical protein
MEPPMSDRSRFSFFAVGCVSSLLVCAVSSPGFARDNCAAYGPDFTLVDGTHSCVRIGSHVRVGFSAPVEDSHFTNGQFGANATAAPLRSDSGEPGVAEPHHIRVDTIDESYR